MKYFVSIESDEEPEVSALTNTGLQPFKPDVEVIECDERFVEFIAKKIQLEFTFDRCTMFGGDIYRIINWWTSTYFSARKHVKIEVRIK